MKNKIILMLAVILTGVTLHAKKAVKPWSLIAKAKGGAYELNAVSPEEFSVQLTRNDVNAKASTMVCRTIDKSMHSQNKLIFMARSSNNNPVKLHFLLSYKDGNKSVLKFGPRFIVKGTQFKNYKLSLDTDFKLGDAIYHIWQLKISADISGSAPGTKAGVEVTDLRIVSPENASFSSKRGEIVVYPLNSKPAIRKDNPLKVYFHFDNEDYATFFGGRGKNVKVNDNCQYPGFRSMLLSTVEKQTKLVDDPAKADVIVYSAARPFPDKAKKIAAAVKGGKPIYVAGNIADPEITELLPGKLEKLENTGLPVRMTLKPADSSSKLFDGINSAAFGKYYQLHPNSTAKVLLSFSNGDPVIAEGFYGKGNVLYSSLGIGLDLITNQKARDAFLLRVLSRLSGKQLAEIKAEKITSENGYYVGAGEHNFGRFGYELGDGLLAETISNDLNVTNGAQEYSFSTEMTPKVSLVNWQITGPGENNKSINFSYKWNSVGEFELKSDCVVPELWKNKSVYFVAEKGIDDTSEVYFNGNLIGKVDENMPRYWMRPQHYLVKPELIKYGSKNSIRIITKNLRGDGGFGSCPELTAVAGKSEIRKFVADRINFLGKGGMISEKNKKQMRFDTSLAFPGIRWEVFSDSVDMALNNIADYVAVPTSNGIVVVDMKKTQAIDTNMSEPWLLLFRNSIEHPLLLVIQKKPEKLLIKHVGDAVAGITFKNSGGVGMIVPLWLYGRAPVNSETWQNGLPDDVMKRIAFWYPKAFQYPLAANEKFAIDNANGRVNISTQYSYKTTQNDWNITSKKYAPVSPLAYYTKGLLFEGKDVEDWKLVTSYGNYAAHNASDTVEWSLPLPSPDLSIIPLTKIDPAAITKANQVFFKGINWSAGGHVKCSDWNPVTPQGKQFPQCLNINMHGWLHGIPQALTAPYGLDPDNFTALNKRVRARLFEAVEVYQYKAAERWREEPFSGIRYPIYFNCRHTHSTKYAEGFGSIMNYGDQNETAQMILRTFQFLADRFGQRDLVLVNQKYIRDVATLLLCSDDWAYMSCHCRESGLSATIDMLNTEFSSMMKLARLAEISGDEALQAQALYRGARRMVPTLARFTFREYAIKNNLLPYPDNVSTCVGFTEQGGHFRSKGYTPAGLDLYDMSQGIPEDLIALYKKYLGSQMNHYFDDVVFRKMFDKSGEYKLDGSMLDIMAQASRIKPDVLRKATHSYLNQEKRMNKLCNDWPGMTLPTDICQVLYRLGGKVKIHTAKDVDIKKFVYSPEANTLTINCVGGAAPELSLETSLEPVAASGLKKVSNNIINIPIASNKPLDIKIQFR